MKRSIAIISILVLAFSTMVWVADASARAGSGGSRGSRSYSAPRSPSSSQVSPSRPTTPTPAAPSAMQSPMSQGRNWGGMLGGLLVGGLIGSLLFGGMGGMGGGLFGGMGLLELLVIGGLIFFAISWMRKRQAAGSAGAPAYAGAYGSSGFGSSGWQQQSSGPALPSGGSSAPTAVLEPPAEVNDVDRGVSHIRQMDGSFDPTAFGEAATDTFFKVQAAWTTREMARVSSLLTPEMLNVLQSQCDRLRSERRINRLENIAVRQAAVTEAWQEKGQDFVTVYFLASLVDYTTDESGAQVLEGSRTEPVKFEEYWTFTRPVGPNAWKLSAIQQAA